MPAARAALAARPAASTTDGAPMPSTTPFWKSISSRTGREPGVPGMGVPPRKSAEYSGRTYQISLMNLARLPAAPGEPPASRPSPALRGLLADQGDPVAVRVADVTAPVPGDVAAGLEHHGGARGAQRGDRLVGRVAPDHELERVPARRLRQPLRRHLAPARHRDDHVADAQLDVGGGPGGGRTERLRAAEQVAVKGGGRLDVGYIQVG